MRHYASYFRYCSSVTGSIHSTTFPSSAHRRSPRKALFSTSTARTRFRSDLDSNVVGQPALRVLRVTESGIGMSGNN